MEVAEVREVREVERGRWNEGGGRGEEERRQRERDEEGLQTGRRGDAHNLRPFRSLQSTK